MSDLINEIRRAQVRAGEQAVIDHLDRIGLGDGNTKQLTEQAKNLQYGISRYEFHEKAWALYQTKRINSTMLENASIHEIRNIFDSIYDALFVT